MDVPDADRSLRAVLDILLQEIALSPIDPAALPWDRPVLILRTVPLEAMEALLADIRRRAPNTALHVMSHGRDAEAIRALAPSATFHEYSAPGRYRLEGVDPAMLQRLRDADFGMLLFPDPGTSADLGDEVERMFGAIDMQRMVTYTSDGTFARARDWQRRRQAHAAFLRLVEWYHAAGTPSATP